MTRFNLDLALDNPRAPAPGDILVTARILYRITGARLVDSKIWPNRWSCTVERIRARTHDERVAGTATIDVEDQGEARLIFTERYQRGETPSDYFAGDPS
jgi:hypothetical protein